MITVSPCTPADSAAVVAMWNAMSQIEESCWYQAQPITAEEISMLQSAGFDFALASDGEQPVGFGFWRSVDGSLRLNALAGETAEIYYALMVAFADWGLAQGLSVGWAEISPRETREKAWMDALAAVTSEPAGREPLVEGQDPQSLAVDSLRVSASLGALRQAALDELGG